VEGGTCIAIPILARRELSEVSCGYGDDIVVKFENDSTRRLVIDCDVKLGEHQAKHEQ
jgi:hypothetical protein